MDKGGIGSYLVVQDGSEFSFFLRSGRYYLFVYEDANEDFKYQDTEYAGAYGKPTIIDVASGDEFEGLGLRLKPPGHLKIPPSVLLTSAEDIEKKFAQRSGQIGELTTLDNPDFSDENGALGLWTPVQFYEKIGMKIYFLEDYDPNKIPILFVHGSSGHPATWKDIIGVLDREKFQPWLVYYPSGLRLDTLGERLGSYIGELHLKYQFHDLYVIAHSMGGLVSRSMIQHYAKLPKRCDVPVYITLATPWSGHSSAETGVKLAPAIVPSWYDMVPQSKFLEKLFAQPLPEETDFHLFFAHRGSAGIKFSSGNTDGTVSLSSQLFLPAQDAATSIYGVDEGHVDILSNTNVLKKLRRILDESTNSQR